MSDAGRARVVVGGGFAGLLAAQFKLRFGSAQVPVELSDPTKDTRMPLTFNRSVLGAALRLLSYSGTQASMLPLLMS